MVVLTVKFSLKSYVLLRFDVLTFINYIIDFLFPECGYQLYLKTEPGLKAELYTTVNIVVNLIEEETLFQAVAF